MIELSLFNPAQTYGNIKQFDCGHPVINSFVRNSLKSQVKKNLSVAYVITDRRQNHRFVGFYTITQYTIDVSALSALSLGSLPRSVPCSRLVMLGVDKHYKGLQLGTKLMRHALLLTQSVARQIGSFGLYLDADPLAIGFYQKLGFRLLQDDQSPEPSPMFIPVESIGMG
ncbi:N-acetyltransferase [Betaproteobacteria bacterium]|nr:N-acetyltransferase [Betaproteobacteria bacterium]GHU47527.1 N-acetyltransferase [Betaproteobacteria bacterium]